MANKVGDVIEVALWYNEDQEGEADKAQEGIYKALVVTEDDYNIRLGTVMFESLEPGNDRVPEPSTFFAGTP